MSKKEGVAFTCDGCSCDLSNLVQIRCAECDEYDLCVPCFSKGVSSGDHKPWHDYRVIGQNAYPVFDPHWGIDEELALVEGCEQYGIGSWADVAEHIGSRTPEEVNDHYMKVYVSSPTYPVPNASEELDISPRDFIQERLQRIELFRAQQLAMGPPKPKHISSLPANHEIQGFMPGRLEFDTEVENDAEMTVKDMIFEPEDTELDVDHKLAVLGIYNERLTRRAERKRNILHHGLLEYRKLTAIEKRRSREDRELLARLKPLVRLLSPSEYEQLCESFLAEQQCRRRIAELQEYRQNGIKTFAAAQKYEQDKQTRLAALNRIPSRHSLVNDDGPATIKIRRSGPNPLDISNGLDVDLLSPQEKSLCSQLRIMPRSYLAVKEAIFEELVQAGGNVKRKELEELLPNLEDAKVGRIYDFFQSQNWIS